MQQLLSQAQAQLALSRYLAKPFSAEAVPALSAAQKDLALTMRQADLQISYLTRIEEKSKYATALADLRKENERLLQGKAFEAVRGQPEKYPAEMPAAPLAVLPEQGLPVFWQLPDARPAVAVSLVGDSGRQRGRAELWSIFLVLSTVTLLILSYLPRGLSYLTGLWPEVCVLLAVLGTLAWGLSFPAILLLALAAVARLFWAVRLLRRLVMALLRPAAP